ncbi:MAG: hypothetical protein R3D80_20925 [Paracoccaceae bacterium]
MLRLILVGAALLLGTPAQAATFKQVSGSPIGCTLKISGVIESGDAERLKRLLGNRIGSQGRICFDSPGGSFAEGIRLAESILETAYAVPTGVDAGDRCESACFLAFMAGAHPRHEEVSAVSDRVMHPLARVGFQAPALVIPTGDYNEAEVSQAYRIALASVADLVTLREKHETYVFRDLLLDEMLRVPADQMRYVETVGDATLIGITVYPVALPTRFSTEHAAQSCRSLGRMSEDFDMSDENHPPPPEMSATDEAVTFSAFFNWGRSPSRCSIVYPVDGQPSGMSGDFVPVWSVGAKGGGRTDRRMLSRSPPSCTTRSNHDPQVAARITPAITDPR